MSIFHRKDDDTNTNKRYKSLNNIAETDYEGAVEELIEKCNKIITNMPAISELRADIIELRAEIKERDAFLRELVLKLVDKPTAAQTYAALKNSGSTQNSGSATAGPKGKLP